MAAWRLRTVCCWSTYPERNSKNVNTNTTHSVSLNFDDFVALVVALANSRRKRHRYLPTRE